MGRRRSERRQKRIVRSGICNRRRCKEICSLRYSQKALLPRELIAQEVVVLAVAAATSTGLKAFFFRSSK